MSPNESAAADSVACQLRYLADSMMHLGVARARPLCRRICCVNGAVIVCIIVYILFISKKRLWHVLTYCAESPESAQRWRKPAPVAASSPPSNAFHRLAPVLPYCSMRLLSSATSPCFSRSYISGCSLGSCGNWNPENAVPAPMATRRTVRARCAYRPVAPVR
jgi:hypothetical protein